MWTRLDDELLDHHKLYAAGKRLGPNGPCLALGFYASCLMWTNRYLTDGFLPTETVESFRHVTKPITVADALVHAALLKRVRGGYRIHDFEEYNLSAQAIKERRKSDRLRKRAARAKNGNE